jgi:hypothetical protein
VPLSTSTTTTMTTTTQPERAVVRPAVRVQAASAWDGAQQAAAVCGLWLQRRRRCLAADLVVVAVDQTSFAVILVLTRKAKYDHYGCIVVVGVVIDSIK